LMLSRYCWWYFDALRVYISLARHFACLPQLICSLLTLERGG
jgi:hypothetical protein